MRTPARQAASRANGARSAMSTRSLNPDHLGCLAQALRQPRERKSADSNPRRHASAQRLHPCPSVATCLGSRQKKDSTKSTLSGTPRRSRPPGRPAGRDVRRSLYPCASGHTFRAHGLPPVTFRNLPFHHPTENPGRTQERLATRAQQPLPAAGVFLDASRNTVHLTTFLWYPVLDRRTADGTYCC
jgi:hypothetical protein